MDILISGASRGLGTSLCKKFLAEGHRVFAGITSLEHLRDLAEIQDNPNIVIIPLDVSQKKSIDESKKIVICYTKKLDIIINVAGILLNRNNYIINDSYEDIERTFQVNTIGPIYIVNLYMDLLAESKKATIINISSEVLSIDGVGPMFGSYSMSKTAIAQYAYILRKTFVENNLPIRVFSVHPGRMKTVMGAENGEIDPRESAEGIYKIAIGECLADNEKVYVNYKGESML